MSNRPIAFFDSGIGGSTILKEVYRLLPNENYIYYPDFINNPYGNKSKEELFVIVDNVVKSLLKYEPKIIVCACNTATAMVLDDIREKYKDILFIGTEPSIKVVYDKYKDLKSLVLTTTGTYESAKFKELASKYKTSKCTLVEAPLLAELIENNKDTYSYLKSLLGNFNDINLVVLGCTHYPLAKDNIKKILGDVIFIDGSIGIAKRIKNLLQDNNDFNLDRTGKIVVLSEELLIKKRILDIVHNE